MKKQQRPTDLHGNAASGLPGESVVLRRSAHMGSPRAHERYHRCQESACPKRALRVPCHLLGHIVCPGALPLRGCPGTGHQGEEQVKSHTATEETVTDQERIERQVRAEWEDKISRQIDEYLEEEIEGVWDQARAEVLRRLRPQIDDWVQPFFEERVTIMREDVTAVLCMEAEPLIAAEVQARLNEAGVC